MVFMEKWKNGEKCTKEIQGVLYSLQSNKVHNCFINYISDILGQFKQAQT